MVYKIQNKELDLLAAYNRKEGPTRFSQIMKILGIPVGLISLFAVVFLFIYVSNMHLENKIADAQYINEEIQLKIDVTDKAPYNELTVLEGTFESLQTIDSTLSSLPTLTKEKIMGLKQNLLSGMSIQTISYSQESGQLNASLTSSNVQNIEKYITQLKKNDYYKNITYTGYQQGTQTSTQGTGQIDELTGQEITTNTVTLFYNFNIIIAVDGGE